MKKVLTFLGIIIIAATLGIFSALAIEGYIEADGIVFGDGTTKIDRHWTYLRFQDNETTASLYQLKNEVGGIDYTNIVQTVGNQTIAGNKTFTGTTTVGDFFSGDITCNTTIDVGNTQIADGVIRTTGSAGDLTFSAGGTGSVIVDDDMEVSGDVEIDGGLSVAGGMFNVSGTTGDILRVNDVPTSFPISNSAGVLTNDGSGVLTWEEQIDGNVVKVAKDGTGDYTTIQAAIDSITDSSATNPYTVLVYPGVYDLGTNGNITLNKQYTTLSGISRDSCIITASSLRNSPTLLGVLHVYTYSNTVENLTIKNTAAPGGEAVTAIAHHFSGGGIIRNCALYGERDTYYQYQSAVKVQIYDSYIYGLYDVISSEKEIEVYNTTCEIGNNTAAILYVNGVAGNKTFLFKDCKFLAGNSSARLITFMTNAIATFQNCYLDDNIKDDPFTVSGAGSNTVYMLGNNNGVFESATGLTVVNEAMQTTKFYGVDLVADGNITDDGSNATREIILTASGAVHSTTDGGAAKTVIEMSTNKQNFTVIPFADAERKYIEWTVFLPSNLESGTIKPTVYWTAATADADDVSWKIEAIRYSTGALDAAFGTALETIATHAGTANHLNGSANATAITPAGSGNTMQIRLSRDGADADDTLEETANFIYLKLTYEINKYSNN